MSSAPPPVPPVTTSPPPVPPVTTSPPPVPPVTPAPPPVPPVTPAPPPVTTSPPPVTPALPPVTPSPPPIPVTPSPPPIPVSPSPPPPSIDLTSSPPPPSSPLTPSPTTPSTPLPSSPPPPSSPLTSSPPPPSPKSSPPPPSPSTPTPPRSVTLSPPPPASPSGGGSPRTPPITPGFSPPPPSSPSSNGLPTGVVVGIAIGGVALLVALTLICFLCKKKRRRDDEAPPPAPNAGGRYGGQQQQNASQPLDHVVSSLPSSAPPRPPLAFMSSSSGGSAYDSNYSDQSVLPPQSPGLALGGNYQGTFTYEELSRATNGFSEANLLGQGGFGYVFKGMLRNGKEIAVKQLKAGSAQGEREFQAEVGIISRVHHRHLVALVGYCIADAQRLLVYEFVPNNTLEFHLHGKGRPPMAWSSRLKIAVGSAKGLSYLHENCNPKIIHRDIKAANILIDFNFEAKVADFGLAKIALDTNTHVSTRVMGTFGYLAPEYAASGKLSEKSDVFSFGVVLLELITGRRPVDTKNVYADNSLVDWARPLLTRALEENNFEGVVDTKLNNEYDKEEMARMVACAAASVRHTARRRPRMDQVTRVLEGNIAPSDLNQGIRPGDSNVYSSSHGGSTDYDSNQDNGGINKFRRGAQEYSASSEYSNPTSDYDLYSYGWSTEGPNTREMETDKYEKNNR